MTGCHKEVALIVRTVALLNVTLNALLIPDLGLVGAAISTITSLSLWTSGMYYLVRRKLSLNPTILGIFRT